jgi:hypothetical protein
MITLEITKTMNPSPFRSQWIKRRIRSLGKEQGAVETERRENGEGNDDLPAYSVNKNWSFLLRNQFE